VAARGHAGNSKAKKPTGASHRVGSSMPSDLRHVLCVISPKPLQPRGKPQSRKPRVADQDCPVLVAMEEILARHRKEKRDLQSKVTQKKKNATKKTRKGVNDECERLERELTEKQQAELQQSLPAEDPTGLTEGLQELSIRNEDEGLNGDAGSGANGDAVKAEQTSALPTSLPQSQPKKPNRQKARLARRAAEQEAQIAAAAEEAESLPDLREQEISAMKSQMAKLNLSETFIRPDGHCLFSACAHSMPPALLSSGRDLSKKEPYQNVRDAAARFMADHPDDFAAFLEEPLESYVQKIRDTAEWGGELELQAIARSYKVDINVLQADGRVEKISSQAAGSQDEDPLWLAYYRHSFGLGEHYNALRKKDKT
jgi:OTU domain-containing protein 6